MDGTPFGRYRLIELLGRGGMGEVWRAFDTTIDRVVALKVLPPQFADDQMFQERFRREARAAASLDEPHVVPIHDVGEIDGRLYVTMRLIKGRDLQTILAAGPLEPTRAAGIIEQVASALYAAHRIGLVHRDVKPSNILVAEDDFAYLIDFGIARATGETGLTGTGAVVGTWAYLAPERLIQGQSDPRADIYALTCVLHECLTGSQPFPANSLEQQIAAHVSLPPPRPSTLRAGLPAELDTVIATGMAKNPDDRYASTRELATAARAAITQPIATPEPTMPARSAPNRPGGARRNVRASRQLVHTRRCVALSAHPAAAAWTARPTARASPARQEGAVGRNRRRRSGDRRRRHRGAGDGQPRQRHRVSICHQFCTRSSATPDTTASSQESERQRSLTTQAIHRSCEALSSSSVDAITAVNNYVDAFNGNAADVAAKTGPAIDSLNHSADLVSGSLSDALSPQLRDALTGWVDAARALATAIAGNHGPDQFNAAITRLNDTKTKALDLCDKLYAASPTTSVR